MAGDLSVLAWITESGWEACVDAVVRLAPTEVTLIHVASTELPGPRGRRHEQVMARMADLAGEAAQALLDDAAERLASALGVSAGDASGQAGDATAHHGSATPGVTTFTLAESGVPEDVLVQAAADADLLVLTRDTRHPGPHSLGHEARFVVDHAPCDVLLVWPGGGPDGPAPKAKPKPKPGAKPKPKPEPR